jgi:hypothetical protein
MTKTRISEIGIIALAGLLALAAPVQAAEPFHASATAMQKTMSGRIDDIRLPNITIDDRVFVVTSSTLIRRSGRTVGTDNLGKGMMIEFTVPRIVTDGPLPIIEISISR